MQIQYTIYRYKQDQGWQPGRVYTEPMSKLAFQWLCQWHSGQTPMQLKNAPTTPGL